MPAKLNANATIAQLMGNDLEIPRSAAQVEKAGGRVAVGVAGRKAEEAGAGAGVETTFKNFTL